MKVAKSSPKWVENTVGKGEIARCEQFLLFPQCFQKVCTTDTQKPGLVWERVKKDRIKNNVGKGERLLEFSIVLHRINSLPEN